MRTRVKICGITGQDCLEEAVLGGADALGFNMYKQSPRYLDVETAADLLVQVPAFVTRVGLFVNEEFSIVRAKCDELPFDLLQFHGDETNEFCRQFGKPFIKVLRIKEVSDFELTKLYPDAQSFLFDAYVEGLFGGTGQTIEQEVLRMLPSGSILAGGLNPSNVEDAISQFSPFAVDVSSGVEKETAKKSPELLNAFFQAVRSADRSKS